MRRLPLIILGVEGADLQSRDEFCLITVVFQPLVQQIMQMDNMDIVKFLPFSPFSLQSAVEMRIYAWILIHDGIKAHRCLPTSSDDFLQPLLCCLIAVDAMPAFNRRLKVCHFHE